MTISTNFSRFNYSRKSESFFDDDEEGEAVPKKISEMRRMKKSEFFKRLDRIQPEYEMIYGFQLNHTLSIGKMICVLTPVALAAIFVKDFVYNNFLTITSSTNIVSDINYDNMDIYYSLLGLGVSNVIVYYFLNKIILRIYRHNEDYIAVKAGIIPTIAVKIPFKKGEICESFDTKLSFLRLVNYKLNGERIFLMPHRFRQPNDIFTMLPKHQAKKYRP